MYRGGGRVSRLTGRAGALLLAAVVATAPSLSRAQVAPVGSHHLTIGPGGGVTSPVSPTGGFAASVPLDLPAPRGNLPLPLSIGYTGTTRAGAAGSGWDIPLWTIRRSSTTWHRKPSASSNEVGHDHVPERITMSLGGTTHRMVPGVENGLYLPFIADEYMELRRSGSAWTLDTANGRRYEFASAESLGAAGLEDLWLLARVRDRTGSDKVELRYEVANRRCGIELDLTGLSYTFDAGGTVALYDVELAYRDWTFDTTPTGNSPLSRRRPSCGEVPGTGEVFRQLLARTDLEHGELARSRIVDRVTVKARNNLAPSLGYRVLRAYQLGYAEDVDTTLPRLVSVDVTGEQGSSVQTIPVVRYEYGSASRYGAPLPLALPSGVSGSFATLASTDVKREDDGRREEIRTRHVIRDFTGDGLPDFVYKSGGQWRLHAASLVDGEPVFADAPTMAWAQPAELSLQITSTHQDNKARMTLTETLAQFMDWNGDGRLDVVEIAQGHPGEWRVWFNWPSPSGAIEWEPRLVSVHHLREHAVAEELGHLPSDYLPLERSRSWQRYKSFDCNRFRVSGEDRIPIGECLYHPLDWDHPWQLDTVHEWTIRDINGDSLPDLLATNNPVRRCVLKAPWDEPGCERDETSYEYLECMQQHAEWLSVGHCADVDSPADIEAMGDNEIVVFRNVAGVFTNAQRDYGPILFGSGDRGVEAWTTGNSDAVPTLGYFDPYSDAPPPPDFDLGESWHSAGVADPHGRGIAAHVFWDYFTTAQERHDSDRPEQCVEGAPNSRDYSSRQTAGLADLNGDGQPDRLTYGRWWVLEPGTSAGFTAQQSISSPDFPFALSETTGTCGGDSTTTAGLIDLDGDGKPELVRVVDGQVRYARLGSATTASHHDIGRLIAIDNGQGAVTRITYANAKDDPYTSHAAPVPEIVVSETQTVVEDGSAVDSAVTRHAYGDAIYRYDPVAGRHAFAGYQRHVQMVGVAAPRPGFMVATVTVTDRAPHAPYLGGFEAYALGGRVNKVSRFEGELPDDPREQLLLTFDSPQLRGQVETSHRMVELPVSPWSGTLGFAECSDHSPRGVWLVQNPLCQRAAIVYPSGKLAWEGTQGPFTLGNVMVGSSVQSVDERGRPTEIADYGDFRTVADDRCISIDYAEPAAGALPAISAVSAVWVTDCGWRNATTTIGGFTPGVPETISGTELLYDGLAPGLVTQGRLTQRIVHRIDQSTLGSLGEYVAETLGYDALGQVDRVQSTRTLGGAGSRTTTFEYDALGATVRKITEVASDVATPMVRTIDSSTWPSVPMVVVEPGGQRTTVERDGFGRATRTRISAGGVEHVASVTDYSRLLSERRLSETVYPGAAGAGVTSHVFLDAFGRVRFSQHELGADYGGTTLVTGLVHYDAFGRPWFRAAPFEWPELPFVPDELPEHAFGVTTTFDLAGRPVRVVEGPGPQLTASLTNRAADVYAASFQYSWQDGLAITRAAGPDENDPLSPAFGVWDQSKSTGLGWTLETSRHAADGTRLDLVRRGYDRLGNPAQLTRFKDPAAAASALTWTTTFDSLGQALSFTEPGVATRFTRYDEWGAPYETEWRSGQTRNLTRSAYDGLGRLRQHQLLTVPVGGTTETIQSTERYAYDAHSGSSHQPPSPSLLGQLSRIETVGVGDVYFEYDAFGRKASESHLYTGHGQRMRTKWAYEPGGALRELGFETTAGVDRIAYAVDSAARTRKVTDLVANRVLFDAQQVDAEGRYRSVLLGNGTAETYQYEADGRELLSVWSVATASENRTFTIGQRDAEGKTLAESYFQDGAVHVNTYTHDLLGQVTRTLSKRGGSTLADERFTYDPLGNITTRRDQMASSFNKDYGYDGTDLDRLCRVGTPGVLIRNCNVQYDALGNVASDSTVTQRYFSYDVAGRATFVQRGTWRASFLYGPGGALVRTEVVNGSTLNRKIWSFGGLIEERTRPDGRVQVERRVPGPLGIVATLRTASNGTETVYVHGDGRANRFFTRADGQIAQTLRYRQYGGIAQDTGIPSQITYTDDQWNGGDDLREVGVVVLGARLYDPLLGRFLQRDPIVHGGSSAKGNPYSFAFNNPVDRSDPTGLSPECEDAVDCAGGAQSVPVIGDVSSGDAPLASPPESGGMPAGYSPCIHGPDPYCTDGVNLATGGVDGYWDEVIVMVDTPTEEWVVENVAFRRWGHHSMRFDPTRGWIPLTEWGVANAQQWRQNMGSGDPRVARRSFKQLESMTEMAEVLDFAFTVETAALPIGGGAGLLKGGSGVAAGAGAGAGQLARGQLTARSSFWGLKPFSRGRAIEKALGTNLPSNFPVIDRFVAGVATSIKSIDLAAKSYRSTAALTRTVRSYIDSVAGFTGRTWGGVTVRGSDITARALELAVPAGGGTAAQQAALQSAVQYGQSVGVTVRIIPF